jgi:hypothetical protein
MYPPAPIRRGQDNMPGRSGPHRHLLHRLGHNGARITRNRNLAASRRFPGCLAAHTAAELRQRTSGTFAGRPLAKILPRRAYRRISPMPYSCLGSAAIVTPGESQ